MTIDGEDMSAPVAVEQHYSTGLTRANIERALIDAGKDPAALEPADLAVLEDFHTMGRFATAALAELAERWARRTASWTREPGSAAARGSSPLRSAAG